MPRDYDLESLVPAIYEAAIGATPWRTVLEGMVERLGGHAGSFICRRPDGSGGRCIEMGFDPVALAQFFGYFASRNVLLQRSIDHPAGTIVADRDVLTKAEFRRSEYYNDLLLKLEDTNAILTAFLWRDADRFVVFNCNRSPRQPEFEAADKEALRPLLGHFTRAIAVALRLGTLETIAATGAAPYESAPDGVLVLDGGGRLVQANPAGERLLREADGIDAGPDGLRAATPKLT